MGVFKVDFVLRLRKVDQIGLTCIFGHDRLYSVPDLLVVVD